MKKRTKFLSGLLTIIMLLSMLVSTAGATSAAVSVKIDGTTNTYWNLGDALKAIPDGKNAEVTINETLNETSPVTISATTGGGKISITGLSGVTSKTPLIVSGKSDVTIGYATFDTVGDAITVNSSDAKLTVGNGASIKGDTAGVRNQGGTVDFQSGNKVSSYVHMSGTVTGSWGILPTPTPTATPTPTSGSTVAVTGVTGIPSDLTMRPASVISLSPIVLPLNATNQNVTYSSSNTSIVSVTSAGYVTAKASGKAVITVKTVDGGFTTTCAVTVSSSATASPTATATTTATTIDAPVYVARNAMLYLDKRKVSGSTTKSPSNSRVTRRPLSYKAAGLNQMTIPVVAFTYLDKEDYDILRYDLPWIKVDIYDDAVEGMASSNTLTIGVQRITPTGTMKTRWDKVKSKNLSGPWSVTSNAKQDGFVYRFALPAATTKSKVRVVKWDANSNEFKDISSYEWSLVRIGSDYYARTDILGNGIYAVLSK